MDEWASQIHGNFLLHAVRNGARISPMVVATSLFTQTLMSHSHNSPAIFTAAVVGGSFIMAAAYGGCDLNVVGTFFTIAVGGQGFLSASLFINVMDLAPNYAGVLSGIIGVFGCCMGILVPNAVSFLTPNVSRDCDFFFAFG